jgi:hypothetical protein
MKKLQAQWKWKTEAVLVWLTTNADNVNGGVEGEIVSIVSSPIDAPKDTHVLSNLGLAKYQQSCTNLES